MLKPDGIRADKAKAMGAPAVTTTPLPVDTGRGTTKMRRTGIWMSVVGVLLTLLGGVVVLVLRDGPDPTRADPPANQSPLGADGGSGPATTIVGAPAPDRPPGTIAARPTPGAPASSPDAPPPATPEQVAELLAGLPQQLEQAATSEGQPRELSPEEVDKIIEDLLRQLGAQP